MRFPNLAQGFVYGMVLYELPFAEWISTTQFTFL